MTTHQIAPPPPATPYVPTWALYVYDDIAYLTFNGKLEATATCRTPDQQTRIEATLARLKGVEFNTFEQRQSPLESATESKRSEGVEFNTF